MSVNNNYPVPPANQYEGPRWNKLVAVCLRLMMFGKTNNCGEVTLRNGHVTTLVDEPLSNKNSVIIFSPITAHAAAVTGGYVVADDKTFTIHHDDPGAADATFRYILVG